MHLSHHLILCMYVNPYRLLYCDLGWKYPQYIILYATYHFKALPFHFYVHLNSLVSEK